MAILESQSTNQDSRFLRVLDYLREQFEQYPFEVPKDIKYFEQLFLDFPSLDIEEELKQYHAWVLDQPREKKISYRSRFRQWLRSSLQFRMGHIPTY